MVAVLDAAYQSRFGQIVVFRDGASEEIEYVFGFRKRDASYINVVRIVPAEQMHTVAIHQIRERAQKVFYVGLSLQHIGIAFLLLRHFKTVLYRAVEIHRAEFRRRIRSELHLQEIRRYAVEVLAGRNLYDVRERSVSEKFVSYGRKPVVGRDSLIAAQIRIAQLRERIFEYGAVVVLYHKFFRIVHENHTAVQSRVRKPRTCKLRLHRSSENPFCGVSGRQVRGGDVGYLADTEMAAVYAKKVRAAAEHIRSGLMQDGAGSNVVRVQPYHGKIRAVSERAASETVQIRYVRADHIDTILERLRIEHRAAVFGFAEIRKVYAGKRAAAREKIGSVLGVGYIVRVVSERSERTAESERAAFELHSRNRSECRHFEHIHAACERIVAQMKSAVVSRIQQLLAQSVRILRIEIVSGRYEAVRYRSKIRTSRESRSHRRKTSSEIRKNYFPRRAFAESRLSYRARLVVESRKIQNAVVQNDRIRFIGSFRQSFNSGDTRGISAVDSAYDTYYGGSVVVVILRVAYVIAFGQETGAYGAFSFSQA